MAEISYRELIEVAHHDVPWRRIEGDHVEAARFEGTEILKVRPSALADLAFHAFSDIAHLLRPGHLRQLRSILDDKEASDNDRFVALINTNIIRKRSPSKYETLLHSSKRTSLHPKLRPSS